MGGWEEERGKVHHGKLQTQSETFSTRVVGGWGGGIAASCSGTFGLLSIKPSADYLGAEELNVMQIHLKVLAGRRKSRFHQRGFVSPSAPPPPPPTHPLFLLRIARLSRQMPRLISALPLAQQLSNKPDISVGLLSAFCVTGRVGVAWWDAGERGGGTS